MATVTMNTEAAIVVTSNFCFVGKWNCDDTLHVPPGGQVVYIDASGTQQTYSGICGKDVVTINAQSIVSSAGCDPVDCGVTEFTFDADYAVLTYKFNDGSDLDTRSRIVEPNIGMNNYLGFEAGACFPADSSWSKTKIPSAAVIDWSGDNTGTGYESILIDIQKLKTLKPDMVNFVVDLRAAWFTSIGILPVEVKAIFYKGGTMIKCYPEQYAEATNGDFDRVMTYEYGNPTATNTLQVTSDSKVINTRYQADGGVRLQRLAVFKYNVVTKVGSFDINDTTTPTL